MVASISTSLPDDPDRVLRLVVGEAVSSRRGRHAPLRLVESPPHEPESHGVPVAGMVAAAVVVFGLLAVVRLLQGAPPDAGVAERTPDPRVPAPALVGPGDQLRSVRPGDTLWSIAVELAPDADPRPVVDALAEANGGTEILSGQELVIPAELLAG